MKTNLHKIILVVFLLSLINELVNCQLYDWRGPGRTGVYNEANLLTEWPEKGPDLLWKINGIGSGFSSVTISENTIYITGKKEEVDVLTALTLDGKKKWETVYGKSWNKTYPDSRCTATYYNGRLFVVSGQGDLVCIDTDGTSAEVVWKSNDIDPHHGDVVLLDKYLYSSTYENNSLGRWICVDWATGKTMWIKKWYNKGSIISADGMIYIYEEKSGHVGLVRPDKTKLDIINEFQITKGEGSHWAHLVIRDGNLYIRHGDNLMVYSIKAS